MKMYSCSMRIWRRLEGRESSAGHSCFDSQDGEAEGMITVQSLSSYGIKSESAMTAHLHLEVSESTHFLCINTVQCWKVWDA